MKSHCLYPSDKLYVSKSRISGAGRGVFAKHNIRKGNIIERCPVIEIPAKQVKLLKSSELLNYYFLWGKDLKKVAIALGYGSLYNHSYEPNATYKKKMREQIVEFIAIKDIGKNEEITVNYNFGNPKDGRPLWIKSIKTKVTIRAKPKQ